MKSKLCGKVGEQRSCARLCLRTQGVLFFCFVLLLHKIRRTLCLPPRLFCLTLVLPLPSFALPSRSSPGLYRSHFHFASVFKQDVSATCQWTPREWGKFILYFYCLFRFLAQQRVKTGSSGKRPSVMSQRHPNEPNSTFCLGFVHIQTWKFQQSTRFFTAGCKQRVLAIVFVVFILFVLFLFFNGNSNRIKLEVTSLRL